MLVEVDEQPIGRVGQLQQTIAMRRPGDRIDVKVYRDGRPLTVEIRLGEAPLQREPVVAVTEPAREERMDDKLGLRIEDMTRQNAAEFGYDDIEGPVITDVQVNGPAARRGLTPGWRVLEINRQVVEDAGDVRRIMSRVGRGDIVTLHLAAPNATRQIVHVKVPD